MSDKLREAAQQALAFTMRDFATMRDFEAARAVLHDDLRAALAEPVQEPVGWFESPHGAFRANPQYKVEFPSQLLAWSVPVYTAPPHALRAALAEHELNEDYERGFIAGMSEQAKRSVDRAVNALAAAVAEPVAWMDRDGDLYKMPEIDNWAPPHTLLYAAPPQREPLTEEEIYGMYSEPSSDAEMVEFARAIERAHGIGE